jgi:LPXTG-motif cell wall-anchored protein
MADNKEFPTPAGWTRNARGFDEPPNTSPGAKSVLLFFAGIVALILAAFLIARVV